MALPIRSSGLHLPSLVNSALMRSDHCKTDVVQEPRRGDGTDDVGFSSAIPWRLQDIDPEDTYQSSFSHRITVIGQRVGPPLASR